MFIFLFFLTARWLTSKSKNILSLNTGVIKGLFILQIKRKIILHHTDLDFSFIRTVCACACLRMRIYDLWSKSIGIVAYLKYTEWCARHRLTCRTCDRSICAERDHHNDLCQAASWKWFTCRKRHKTWMRLLTWVYNQYIKAILRKLEVLLGFILYNFSNIRCRWHRDDDRIRRQTAGNSKQGSKRKRKERIDYQLEECRIHCCLEEEQMPKHSVVYSNAWN